MKAFISYSHRDAALLKRLHTHLAVLKRERLIGAWYDREILAGGDIDREIERELSTCKLFLALVSPDFLSSPYCYDVEFRRAMERHNTDNLTVVPIILEPCDWGASPLKRFKAVPNDGRAVTEWTNENSAFLDVVTELRRLCSSSRADAATQATEAPGRSATPSTPKYRVKKTFDEIDRLDFARESYLGIRDYFRGAISEIDKIDGLRGRYTELGETGFTCTVLNQLHERGQAHITVHLSVGRSGAFGDISYSFAPNAPPNTSNGWLSVQSDEFLLFLSLDMFANSQSAVRATSKEAAERVWRKFVEQAGITVDDH